MLRPRFDRLLLDRAITEEGVATLNAKVLVVEDDAGLQETLAAVLEFEGYEVLVARDGIEALEILGNGIPALILLDLMMPRMDGFAFVKELQQRGLRTQVPVVVLTADGRAAQKADVAGADGYVEKPFQIPVLMEEIERFVRV